MIKLKKVLIRITEEQEKKIIQYQKENNLTTKAEAYRHMISNIKLKEAN